MDDYEQCYTKSNGLMYQFGCYACILQSKAAPNFNNSYPRADVLVTAVVFKFFKFKGWYLAEEGQDLAAGGYCQAMTHIPWH